MTEEENIICLPLEGWDAQGGDIGEWKYIIVDRNIYEIDGQNIEIIGALDGDR